MGKVILTGKGRRWYLRGHPWIYKDDVATGDATPGELVPVEDPNGAPLGWGLFSSQSRIRVRMVTREAEQPNRAFWAERLQRAQRLAPTLGLGDYFAYKTRGCTTVSGGSLQVCETYLH